MTDGGSDQEDGQQDMTQGMAEVRASKGKLLILTTLFIFAVRMGRLADLLGALHFADSGSGPVGALTPKPPWGRIEISIASIHFASASRRDVWRRLHGKCMCMCIYRCIDV